MMKIELENLLKLTPHKSKFKIEGTSFPCSMKEREGNVNMNVRISNIAKKDMILLKCPDNQPDFFNENYQKVCDYVILLPDAGMKKLAIVFCELKKNQNCKNIMMAVRQLRCSIPLLDYIISGLKCHAEIGTSDRAITRHYAIFFEKRNRTIDKQATHSFNRLKQSHGSPIRCKGMKINVFIGKEEISLRQLMR